MAVEARPGGRFKHWLLAERIEQVEGPETSESKGRQKPWWKIVCLTGVDYFSTLGYIPGIAVLAAGVLSPIAMLLIVALTLFAMAPMYRRVAEESPHGQGSISMLERLLSFWPGKLTVLVLLGFIATDFMITITLSASDAAVNLAENPLVHALLVDQNLLITLLLVAVLGAVFLKGFKKAINLAVVIVGAYLFLNLVVVAVGLYLAVTNPASIADWTAALFANYGNPLVMVGVAFLLFPKLALGISGFETGVSVMPLVRGDPEDDPEHPAGRIRNTRTLFMSAALIMSFYLLTSSFVTVVLIPAKEFESGGSANGRALAYLAHEHLGSAFGTVYDLSTVVILAFAGASALAGLLNVVPRYLPRYGMAPEWGRALRPLVLLYTAIAFAITVIFNANVDAQGGAYATGVLVIMTSAAFAVMLSALWNDNSLRATLAFGLVTLIFHYTLVANIFERPDGIKIASFFIAAIVVVSLASRVRRSLELRQERIEIDEKAKRFIVEASKGDEIHIIAHRRRFSDDPEEYTRKLEEQREYNHIPKDASVLFLEIDVEDPSEFEEEVLEVRGVNVGGYRVLRGESTVVPNAIAAFLLYLRDETGKTPNCYFGWTEGNPFAYVIRYILFGEGDTAPVTLPEQEKRESLLGKIVVAIDGSEEASAAAQTATEVAKATGSEVHLVYAMQEERYRPHLGPEMWEGWEEGFERAKRSAHSWVEKQAELMRGEGAKTVKAHLLIGRPDAAIVWLAEEVGTGLVVVGNRGLGGIRRALTGSVSDSVARHAHCPVMVIRSEMQHIV